MSPHCIADQVKEQIMNPLTNVLARSVRQPRAGQSVSRRQRNQRSRLSLELLEDRTVPSALSVADVSVREGPTSTGILDPAGAASVGINGIKGIIFDNGPTDPHYGDLFVTGTNSHSVARFDWASQTYQPFVLASNNGGLSGPDGITVGPDGNVYVSDPVTNIVYRYDSGGNSLPAPGQTGAVFVPAGSGGLNGPSGLAFGPDGSSIVTSYYTNQILKYQGPAGSSPGAYIGVLVSTGLVGPDFLTIGPDGDLYVGCNGGSTLAEQGHVNRYDPSTGAPIGTGDFVTNGSGGLTNAVKQIVFDASGANMYVVQKLAANAGPMGEVLRYQGPAGQNPGAYVEAYVTGGQGGLLNPIGVARDRAGNIYVSDLDAANVTRFAPASQASFVVTLDSASGSQVSVSYATADGTALAGTDYTQTSGTLIFPAGVTSETVNVPITTTYTGGPTKTFTLTLSGASGASISRGTATGSVLNRQTKFFVVDGGTLRTYQYGSGGTSEEIRQQGSTDTAPTGAATTSLGSTLWVVDSNKTVYVYDNHNALLGSWSAGGLSHSATLTGIATNGTDIWLLDSNSSKVYKYNGAASLRSGSQNANSNFRLSSSNSNATDMVTDGTYFWVVNANGSSSKVFKYNLSGSLLGTWTIDSANTNPTGITINPTNVSDIWIVDNGTDKVYQYVGAASRTSGSQNAASSFALAANNTNPQGIADPPVPDMLPSPAPASIAANFSASMPLAAAPSRTSVPAGIVFLPGPDALATFLGGALANRGGEPSAQFTTKGMLAAASDHAFMRLGVSSDSATTDRHTPLAPGGLDGAGSNSSDADLLIDALAAESDQASAAALDTFFARLADEPVKTE
jgi:sugar lactone lactonase YvrE